ncbi:MAG: SLBB domain-containing protein [Cyanobacteria bacterium P01_A01_bin.135]
MTRFAYSTIVQALVLNTLMLAAGLPALADEPTSDAISQPLPIPGSSSEQVVRPVTDSFAETPYVLGVGDEIQIDIANVPEFSGQNGSYTVPVDGTIRLPWAGNVNVQDLTIDEAANAIERAYAPFINDPLVTLNLVFPRPLTVAVLGEVGRPGTYALRFDEGTQSELSVDRTAQWPNVTQAIQLAGGIKQTANVQDVQVVRRQGLATPQIINVDLWALLRNGEIYQDINLRDGDTIVIPKAVDLGPAELTQLADANFSPDSIGVNVVGEVVSPGLVEVEPNTTLNQAILAAGGFTDARARRKRVELVRLNPNGAVERRRIDVDLRAGVDDEVNPALQPGDVVIVNRNAIARGSDALDLFLNPIGGAINIFRDVIDIFDN